MNADFPRILCLLRKEKNISQKQAAAELGVSQALLSHYEKGIRECGLEFLTRAADYYGVSCDYMLGRSPDRSGTTLTFDDIPDSPNMATDKGLSKIGAAPILTKKLIINSLNILFDLMVHAQNKALANEVSSFLLLAVYRMFRIIYASDPKNQDTLFAIPKPLATAYTQAAMSVCEANAAAITHKSLSELPLVGEVGELVPQNITTEGLSQRYPNLAPSLFNLIRNAEQQALCRDTARR